MNQFLPFLMCNTNIIEQVNQKSITNFTFKIMHGGQKFDYQDFLSLCKEWSEIFFIGAFLFSCTCQSYIHNSNETNTLMGLGRSGRFGQS